MHASVERPVELERHLPRTQPVQSQQQRNERRAAREPEPGCLPEHRGDREVDRGALLVPHAAIVTGYDMEPILSWRQIGIERQASISSVIPTSIPAIESIAKLIRFRCDQAQSRVVDLEIAGSWRQAQSRRSTVQHVLPVEPSVGDDLLDVHRRREPVEHDMIRVEHLDAAPRQKPDLAIGGNGGTRSERAG